MKRFCKRFPNIVNTLGCFDRVIFKGHLPFGSNDHLNRFVDHNLKMRRKDFVPFVQQQSGALVEQAKKLAAEHNAHYEPPRGSYRKENFVDQLIRERGISEGLVAVLCCMETCRTVKLLHGNKRPHLAYARRPQRVLYFYFLDPQFGRMYIRLQTWFPFTMQVYVNGHEWLARQMAERKLGFVQEDNAFTQLDDPEQAQALADRFSKLPWVRTLDRWARLVNPLLKQSWLKGSRQYYWVIDQAEYSTDVLFPNRVSLSDVYARLLEHALLHFSAQDILTFLGRRLHPRFDGEVLTDCKKDRFPGARIKHRVKNNWLKMYDKFGRILRIETVINQPREFRVRRRRLRNGQQKMLWCPMNKGVSNFYHYHAVAKAANERYLDALATVELPCAEAKQLDRLSKPIRFQGRRRRGLNLLHADEQRLFFAVLQGPHRLNGFRNHDILRQLFPKASTDPKQMQKRRNQVTRQLQLLRAHGLIAKVQHSNRYRITTKGEAIMTSAVYARYKLFPKELSLVA